MLLFISQIILSQAFTEQSTPLITGVYNSSVAWGDYDNDGDLDILLTGGGTSQIYLNTAGVFTDIGAGLPGVSEGSAAWGDYDMDGDLDILLTGYGFSKVFRNDVGIFNDINAGLTGVTSSSVAWGDYDNDGDLDILLSGYASGNYISIIYRNTGGIFTDINAGLTGVGNGCSVAWGDYDNDGDLDILLSGYNNNQYTKIYRNDNGYFTEITTNLEPCYQSRVAWGDFDSDGDLDILLSGYDWNLGSFSKIYRNDAGIFTDINAGLTAVQNGSVAWGDYDNDGDLDILLSGYNSSSGDISKVYRNDAGLFTDISAGLAGAQGSSVAWGDYDKDGDLDILLTGSGVSKIYKNNTVTPNTVPLTPINLLSSIAGNVVTLTWNKTTDTQTAQNGLSYNLYIGNATGLVNRESPMAVVPGGLRKIAQKGNVQSNSWSVKKLAAGTYYWSVQAIDNCLAGSAFATEGSFVVPFSNSVAPAADQKLLKNQACATLTATESSTPSGRQWKYSTVDGGPYTQSIAGASGLTCSTSFSAYGTYYVVCESTFGGTAYTSNQVKIVVTNFIEQTAIVLNHVKNGSTAWGDFDKDGDLDILLTGDTISGYISKIYINNGNSTFTEKTPLALTGVRAGSAVWGDYDNDGDLDILLTGDSGSGYISKIYRNDAGVFTDIAAGLTGVYQSSVAWGDYDNDGDLDILLSGDSGSNNYISKIYRNDAGIFTDIAAYLTGVYASSVAWGDYDNDGDLDILLTGYSSGSNNISRIYRNDNGLFTDINAGLTGFYYGSGAWGDYDNDGYLDILLSGWGDNSSKIYRNNNGVFTDINAGLTGIDNSSSSWADYDNDGDLDILFCGSSNTSGNNISVIYQNDNGIFTEIVSDLTGVTNASASWGDYDNDGDLDIILTGSSLKGNVSKIYKNFIATPNTVPSAPSGLLSAVTGNGVNLSWNKASDTQTLTNGLSYNLYIGSAAGTINKKSPMAALPGGYRRVVQKGNIQTNSWSVKRLSSGTYYWSVQATDNAFSGSVFATEGSFTVPFSSSILPSADQTLLTNQNGTLLALTESSTPTSRQWKYSTTRGGPYTNSIPAATGTSYTPNFPSFGTYYIVCESVYNTVTYTSNEVKINVPAFTEQTLISLPGVNNGSVAWGDYDSNGFQDILITGYNSNLGRVSIIYQNVAGIYTDISAGLTPVNQSSVAWGDYDNDGDLDVLLTGMNNSGTMISIIYRNDAGIFTDINAGLTGVYTGSVAWGDYDNDGDLDILLTGYSNSGNISKIYRNDAGIFTDINAGLTGASNSSVAWGDYDNDGDLDILLTGNWNSSIYRNDNGVFTNINAGLQGVSSGSAVWGDYNNDGYLDILITGGDVSKIYRNDAGSFTDIAAGLTTLYNSSGYWGDYDNDGDLDVLLIGHVNGSNDISKIYRNDAGVFTEISADLPGVSQGSVAWGDYDKDGDLDILLTGSGISKVYKNNTPTANTVPSTPSGLLVNVTGTGVTISWDKATDSQTPQNGLSYNLYVGSAPVTINRKSPMASLPDGYRRVIQKGSIQSNSWIIKKLTSGTYYFGVQAIDNNFAGSAFSSEGNFIIPFSSSVSPVADQNLTVNQNGTLLTLVESNVPTSRQWKYSTVSGGPYTQTISGATGLTYTPNFSTWGTFYVVCESFYNSVYYTSNEVKINVLLFSELTPLSLTAVQNSSVAWGDYDNDGDLDVLLSGDSNSGSISKIYQNVAGVFTDINAGLTGAHSGYVTWGDYDNDGDLDIILTGYAVSTNISKIYRNDAGVFTDINAGLTGVIRSSVSLGDYDNDGDLDIFLTGYSGSTYISKIYRNDAGVFTDINAGLTGVDRGKSSGWGDYDGDGDLDILLTGYNNNVGYVTKIYRNDAGLFTDINAGLSGVGEGSSAAWGDYDNDGDLDILLTGYMNGSTFISKIYRNTAGVFADINAGLIGVDHGSAAWGDYDNDGDLDILLTGYDINSNYISKIYRNDGGVFNDINVAFTGVQNSSVAWGDYDNDGDLDILLTGNSTGGFTTKIFKNNINTPNTVPAAPTGLLANITGSTAALTWNKSNDSQTPQNGLSYNLYIGSATGTINKLSPMATLPGGYRRVVQKGIIQTNSWSIKKLYAGTYYWSVQAIDNNFAGSAFATEGSFIIPFSSSVSPVTDQNLAVNQNGSVLTVAESSSPASRQWKYSTVSGGPYSQTITGATTATYTPNFSTLGTYYVVCESVYNTVAYTTNEVKVNVLVFSEQTGISLDGVYDGSVMWGDYDNDGDPDILLTGNNGNNYVSKIYNNNAGVFTDINANLTGVGQSSAAWGDFDNDGDLDILLTGNSNSGPISKIYRNNAGVFTDISASLTGVYTGSVAWGDFDNDGDLDILLTGNNTGSTYISKIYRNDSGVFTDINSGLTGVGEGSSVSWGDYDNDGDLDILLTGYNNSIYSKIYRNDNGIFTEITTNLASCYQSSIAWGDYDNDGDLDILLTGYSWSIGDFSKVYRNDAGVFTDINAVLTGVEYGSSAWGDYDNDGDLDILLTGDDAIGNAVSKIYRNDIGIFNDINAGLMGVHYGSVAWGDYDKDGDLDILLTGNSTTNEKISRIYKNLTGTTNTVPTSPSNLLATAAGSGINLSWNKSTDTQTLQNGLSYNLYIGSAAGTVNKRSPMAALPGGYRRIFQKGIIQTNSWSVKRLTAGSYFWSVQAIDNSFAGSTFAAEGSFTVSFSNSVSPIADQILLLNTNGTVLTVTESSTPTSRQWKYSTTSGGPYNQAIAAATGTTYTPKFSSFGTYYVICESIYNSITYTTNEVKIDVPAFTDQTAISLSGVSGSSVTWGDYDNDGDQDLLLTGYNNTSGYISKIYNNNAGAYTDIVAGLTGIGSGSAAWGDYDNDGDLDILLTGYDNSGYISKIYRNDAGVFTDIVAGLTAVGDVSSVAWGDYDNDGDLDILLTGTDAGSNYISKIYRNDNGVFTDINAGLTPVGNGSSVAWGDYDNDGDLDILLTGYNNSSGNISKIYRNNAGVFTDINAGLTGVAQSSVAWGDYDNDGDLDILLTGSSISKIYRNDNGIFTDLAAGLAGVQYSSAAWGDYDNDGDLDILISGSNIAKIYRNDAGVFTDINTGLAGVTQGSVAWGDYDKDGDLDILLTGSDISKIYKNNTPTSNTVPAAPTGLLATITGTGNTLSWNKATDTQTLQNGLSYNLYIGTTAGAINKKSPMATLPGGYRRIVQKGLIQSNSWSVKKLVAGTYYWSVQAIDNALSGSAFATEGSFVIPFSSSVSPVTDQTLPINQNGTALTVTESTTPTSRQWKYSLVSGGPYTQSISGATGTIYTPTFSTWGTYYVVCESVYSTVAYTSNEVKINVVYFSEQTGITLTGVNYSSVVWGDYDNDGDQDVLITGNSSSGYISKIYNNNAGVFTDINAGLSGVYQSSAAWGDFDNDGDLDIILTGWANSGRISKIYRNDLGVFTDFTAGLPGVNQSSVAWGDYDNDGDLDILLTGTSAAGAISNIYRNDAGVFSDISAGLTGVSQGFVAWGDYDNDGDLDILVTGSGTSKIYRNDKGIFTDISASLTGVSYSSATWGDYDSDGDLDILLTGGGISKIYRNDNGVFADINAGLTGVYYSSAAWGDFDNDGDLDIILSGSPSSGYISKIYRNDAGVFTDINATIDGVQYGSVAWGDYDNDGDLDLLVSGAGTSGYISKIFKNNSPAPNTIPVTPTGLQSSVSGTGVILNWNKSTDTQTLQNGLSYNLYIGSTAGTIDKKSPMAALPGGYRRVVQKGLIQSNSWPVKKLIAGTYYWSVQATDNNFSGSAFTAEASFIVPFSNSIAPIAEQTIAINSNGATLTVTESSVPTSRQWKYSTVSQGPYTQSITGATATTYTPNFTGFGTYYVICESVYNSVSYISNEVKINVPPFTEMTGIALTGVQHFFGTWGDYDNDGDLDLFLSGYINGATFASKIYRNDAGAFTDIVAGLTNVHYAAAAWGDYDNDGDLDLLLTGVESGSNYISKIYRNDAGVFTDIVAGLTGVYRSSVAWGDYDNDGDLDIVMAGSTLSSGSITRIYRNDNSVFTDISAGLTGVTLGSVAWGDYDNDGDLDLLLTGSGYTKIYRNDGGTFTDIASALTAVSNSSGAWGDFDNDGDLDIVVSGNTTKIYRNNGGVFTDMNAGLLSNIYGSSSWGDFDNDGDLDLLITGSSYSKIFRNDSGIFTDLNVVFPFASYSSAAWGDYDNDGDLDIALAGNTTSGTVVSRIYRNNINIANTAPTSPSNLLSSVTGSGTILTWNKSTDTQTAQPGLSYNLYIGTTAGSINRKPPMAALPGGYRRIVQKGIVQNNSWVVKKMVAGTYFWSVQAIDNNFAGSAFPTEGTFTIPLSNSIAPITDQVLAINQPGAVLTVTESSTPVSRQWKYSTVNGGPYDKLFTGITGTTCSPAFPATGTYYVICESTKGGIAFTSNQVKIVVAEFTEQTIIALPGLQYSSVSWGDYDNDGDLDILLTGNASPIGYITRIYRNDAGVFTDIIAGLPGVSNSSVAWGDYDNDGDLDILLTGYPSSGGPVSIIYRNDGGTFNDITAGLTSVYNGSVAWGDYDNDGDLDVLLTGTNDYGYISKVYRNDNGIFKDISAGLTGVYIGSAAWGDYDNDGDLDILLTGSSISGIYSGVYRNDYGVFTDINAGLAAVRYSSVAWGDYDNDGDLDILLTGYTSSGAYISTIYRNNGGTFTDINAGLTGVQNSSVAWGDYDNDGDLDILLTGYTGTANISKVYRNDSGTFTDINAGMTGVRYSSVAWGDYDNDGDLDVLLTGNAITKIYKNISNTANTVPVTPSNLQSTVSGAGVTLSWNKTTDTQTSQNGLSYNIYIGTSANTFNKKSPMAVLPGGYRRIVQKGEIQSNSWTIKRLPAGNYFWSVQATDNALAGSAFATQGTFAVAFSNSVAPADNQTLAINQTAATLTVTESSTPVSRQWKYSTVSGGPYSQSIAGATATTCTPSFSALGVYYVVCESVKGGIAYTSNQVKISVTNFISQTGINLSGVSYGSITWGDYDSDGDLDLLLTGYGNADQYLAKVYRNDLGVFNDISAGLTGVESSSVAWGDYDNDGDLDILLTGDDVNGNVLSKIYRNDTGVFTDINAGLIGIYGAVAWGDYDNDGDLDILLTGYSTGSYYTSRIYRNDNGIFKDINAGLPGISSPSVAWGDYDNDGDLDILMAGSTSAIYRNDNGLFTDIVAGLPAVSYGTASWGDYDSDGDPDILLTGSNYSKIFNNTNGVFTEYGTSLPGVTGSSSAWGDFDNDGDLDIILTGATSSGSISKIFRNDNSVFTEVFANLQGVSYGSVASGDFDNDGDLDILISGTGNDGYVSEIYKNSSLVANTAPSAPSNLLATLSPNKVILAWDKSTDTKTAQAGLSYNLYVGTAAGSVNRKTPMSVIPGGTRKVVQRGIQSNTWTIRNLAAGKYYWSAQAIDNTFAGSAFATEVSFTVAYSNSISPITDQTLVMNQNGSALTVTESSAANSRQWKYSLVSGGPYSQTIAGATGTSYVPVFSTWGTYFVVCESTKDAVAYTSNEVKINVPLFAEQISISLTGVRYGSVAWGDYDNDGDLDMLLTGSATSGYVSKVYRNDSGVFTDINAGLTGVQNSSVAWGDYDNDGDLDILLTGNGTSKIYRNDNGVFTDIVAGLSGVTSGSVAWGDYDNDGDLDFTITGSNISRIYRNDNGVFTNINASLTGVTYSSVAWGDYDTDGDLDILLTGSTNSSDYISKIYRNDSGIFTDINSGLTGVYRGSVAWGDMDGDGDLDILLTGYQNATTYVSKVYRNDNGIFSDVSAGLTGVNYGSAAWGDYDNDGDLDILLTGIASSGYVSKVYRNDAGAFTEIAAGLSEAGNSSVAWGDYDNDGDLDILITGYSSTNGYSSKLYKNNITTANAVPSTPTTLTNTVTGTGITLGWNKSTDTKTAQNGLAYNLYIGSSPATVNKKSPMAAIPAGYRRIVQKGLIQKNSWQVKKLAVGTYYWSVQAIDNTFAGSAFATEGTFNVVFTNSIGPVSDQTLALNSNGAALTVIESTTPLSRQWKYSAVSGGPYTTAITGATTTSYTPNFASSGTYYVICESVYNSVTYTSNEVKIIVPVFTEQTAISLPGIQDGSVSWGDYDSDGDLDLQITGGGISRIYNNSNGIFYDIVAGLSGVNYSSAIWGDYDNDGDLDIILSGSASTGNITAVYRNDSGVFTDIVAGLTGVQYGSVVWGDYDNDGDLDILLTGSAGTLNYIAKIYRNDNGIFTDINAGLTGVTQSSSVWGDYDNDGDLDILLTGSSANSGNISKIYRNDSGAFTDINAVLTGIQHGSAAWGDYDSDGDLDILLTGTTGTQAITTIYRNDAGVFTDIVAGLPGLYQSSVAWGDYDNDGDLDILFSGNLAGDGVSRIYRNDSGIFININDALTGVVNSSVSWADYDNDGDLDLVLTGYTGSATVSKIYRNNATLANAVPSAPANLQASLASNKVTLSWNKSTDSKTAANGLTYNLYIGSAAGTIDKKTPMATIPAGYRKIVQRGVQSNSWIMKNLPAGKYYWSVQAIDNSFAGSAFGTETNFTIAYSNSIAPVADQSLTFNQNGTALTVTESGTADSRQWKYSTVSGGPYNQSITGATGTTYTPVFPTWGIYYVVCVSTKSSITYTSNEVKINVLPFVEQTGISLTGIRYGAVSWSDYDNDGDLDLLISGYSPTSYVTKIYRNDSGVFTEINPGLTGTYYGSVAWGDYDNDGYVDLLLTGSTTSGYISKVYHNVAGVFTEINAGLPGVMYGSSAWGDYDNDGDLDILLSGATSSTTVISRIYRNDNGVFTDINAGLKGVQQSSVSWGDYDNDGDKDIFLSGYNNPDYFAKIYRNDNGVFTDINATLTPVAYSSSSWGDFDNDGDLDLLVSGGNSIGNSPTVYLSSVYRNNNGVFTDINAGLTGVYYGSASWGDFDNDGDLDILLTGSGISKVYKNDSGVFTDLNAGFMGLTYSAAAWGDYDNDGDLDIIMSGMNGTSYYSKIYKNFSSIVNTASNAPTNLVATALSLSKVNLTWNKATDTQTPQNSLAYNLRIGTTAGGIEKISPLANLTTGFRRIPASGNVDLKSDGYPIGNLTPGTYYWSVQAIDQAYAGGAWATESSFTLLEAPVASAATNLAVTSLTANWSASAGAIGYRLDVASDIAFTTLVTGYNNKDVGNVTSATVTGLSPNTVYYYRIKAYEAGGTSIISSNTITTTTLDIPSIPTATAATAIQQTSFAAKWNSSSTATGYRLDVASDNGFTTMLTGFNNLDVGNVTSYSVIGLTKKTVYYYRVRAYNVGGTSGNSNTITVTTLPNPPSAPTGLSVTSCNNSVTLTWTASTETDFLRYRIYSGATATPTTKVDSTTTTISETTKVITGLTNGQTYYFSVSTVITPGVESPLSTSASVKVKTGVIPKIKSKWNDILISYNTGDSLNAYQWYKGTSAITGATMQYYISNKAPGSYYVVATDKNGCKNTSNTINLSGAKSLSVYPNPASTTFVLNLSSETLGETVVSFYNSSGTKVMDYKTEKTDSDLSREIAVSTLQSGIYSVEVVVNNEEVNYTRLVIIK
jgi:hypothetical protein